MPQRVETDALVYAGGLLGGVKGAIQLAGAQRSDRVAAREQPAARKHRVALPAGPPPGARSEERRVGKECRL